MMNNEYTVSYQISSTKNIGTISQFSYSLRCSWSGSSTLAKKKNTNTLELMVRIKLDNITK